jgi:hypothetical protein
MGDKVDTANATENRREGPTRGSGVRAVGFSSSSPQRHTPYASLDDLVMRALRQYGESNPGVIDGDVMSMFIDFANEIVEEMRHHPYWTGGSIDYYRSQSETRPIPDPIMIAGLQYYYAVQQESQKVQTKGPRYFRTMNRTLYNRWKGPGRPELQGYDIDNTGQGMSTSDPLTLANDFGPDDV